jgi:RES domain-containing protein
MSKSTRRSGAGAPRLAGPPPDLASQRLPISTLKRGTSLFRSHAVGRVPLWFGPKPGDRPAFRFDAPGGEYGVCYAGRSDVAAFVETFFRDLPVRVLSRANLELRAISTLRLTRTLRLVRLYGAGLPRIGATTEVAGAKLVIPAGLTGGAYEHSQAWSLALHDHPAEPDGVQYRSRHDDELLCVALFSDRAENALRVAEIGEPISGQRKLLARTTRRYGVQLL